MSRTGIEEKPPWQQVPAPVRAAVDAALGSRVRRADRVYGGYAPTPTYRLRLDDGRRAFLKAVNFESNPFMHAALVSEHRFYRELQPLVARWSPAMLGWFEAAGWSVLLLEDAGPKSAPPWTPAIASGVMREFAAFHRATRGTMLPSWLEQQSSLLLDRVELNWPWLDSADEVAEVASVARNDAPALREWLGSEGFELRSRASRLADPALESTLLHLDVRSDNLRYRNGRLILLDWPHIATGSPELDVAVFLQSVTAEGGPSPEALLPAYDRVSKLDPALLDASVSAVLSFFLGQAWRPEIPGLPRLRRWQRKQLRATAEWAMRRFDLQPAAWVTALPDSAPGPSL